jgi:Tol biopolymer transport system component
VKKLSSGTFLVVATVVLGLGLGVFGILKLRSWNRAAPTFARFTTTKLTTASNVVTAAISPSGQAFAYVSTDGSRQSLHLRHIDTTAGENEIFGPAEVTYHGLTFSPDGNIVFFVRSSASDPPALYRVSVRGGEATLLYKDVSGAVAVSADGRSLAYVRDYPDQQQTALVVALADGSNERIAVVLKTPDGAFLVGPAPAFSPNGKLVAIPAKHDGYQNVMVVNVTNGTTRPIGDSRFQSVGRINWHTVGGGLVVVGAKDNGVGQVWQMSYPSGDLTRVTNDSNNYQSATMARDSHQILMEQTQRSGDKQGDLVLLKVAE